MKYLNLFGDKYYKILANQLPSGLQNSPNLSMVDQIGLFEFDEIFKFTFCYRIHGN